MKKFLNVVLWIFVLVIVIGIVLFIGNLVRNMIIINKIYSAKEKIELLNNYKLDYEIIVSDAYVDDNNVSQNEKKTYRYVVKDNNTRINEYSYNGAAFQQYKVKSSTLKYDDVEDAKEMLSKMVIDDNIISKKSLVKEFLFKPIKKDGDTYSISICTDVKEKTEYYTHLWIDVKTGYITSRHTYETDITTSELREIKNSVREYFKIKCDIVTDKFLSEVDENFEAF